MTAFDKNYAVVCEGQLRPEDNGTFCEIGLHPMSIGTKFYIVKETESMWPFKSFVCEDCHAHLKSLGRVKEGTEIIKKNE
jgi:hypothetical protein